MEVSAFGVTLAVILSLVLIAYNWRAIKAAAGRAWKAFEKEFFKE
jgi:hypothetical protein